MSARPIPVRPLRVLVVENDSDVADSLAAILESAGCEVRTALCGEDALQMVESFVPDAAILDVGMPDTDGVVLAHLLRDRPELKKATLIAHTAFASEWAMKNVRSDWVFGHYLLKPADPEELAKIVCAIAAT